MQYRIAWQSRLTGTTGHGDWMSPDLAEAWLRQAKVDCPELDHWLEYRHAP